MPLTPRVCRRGRRFESVKQELQFQLEISPELSSRRRRGLAVSVGLHVLLVLFFIANPDLLRSPPKRIIRIAGQDFDLDRFDIQELYLPPELVPAPPPPAIAENIPPQAEAVPPPVAAPPPPPPPPPQPEPEFPPPPDIIEPDDVIAEGARPDADPSASAGETLQPETFDSAGAEEPLEATEEGDAREAVEEMAGAEPETGEEADPEPEITDPHALRLPDLRKQAEDIVAEEAARRLSSRGRSPGVDDGLQALPNFSTEQPTILSDTRGYDFGPYMNQVINRVRVNWYSFIPEAARLGQLRGRAVITFTITKNGGISDIKIVANSGAIPLDRAAVGAIQASNPFPRLPDDYDDDHIVLQFTFLYNMS